MRIISFGDIHDNLSNLEGFDELRGADLCVLGGDLTNRGSVASTRRLIEAIRTVQPALLAQCGNMDGSAVQRVLDDLGLDLHRQGVVAARGRVGLGGVGGSNPTPFGTPREYREDQIAAFLREVWRQIDHARLRILFVHAPPFGTVADRLPSGAHVGSRAVRDFALAARPEVLVCGHIHESRGLGRLGETIVVNPGPFRLGGYVRIDVGEEEYEVSLRHVRDLWPPSSLAGAVRAGAE